MEHSVVVVGSGAAGLSAALAAAEAGASATVLERSPWIGGTTAMSGGVAWIPCSDAARAAGVDDTPDDALRYLRSLGQGDFEEELAAAYVGDAARVARAIEAATPLEWALLPDWPDYQSELDGGRAGGRSIWPRPIEVPADLARRIHPTLEDPVPTQPTAASDGRITDGVVFRGPVRGRVLVAGIVMALAERGVEIRTDARVTELVTGAGGDIVGVEVDGETVAGSVVLASGGFQHAPDLVRAFLPGADLVAMGAPGCEGDGLRMAQRAGAALGNMADAWWMPAMGVPGEDVAGAPFFRPLHHERAQPGSLMIDRHGHRFVNEAQNYGDTGRAMLRFDPSGYEWPAAPSWLVFDRAYRDRTAFGPLAPGGDDPDWLRRAPDLRTLAAHLGLDPDVVEATVATFNADAAGGRDHEFGRGAYVYDRWIGDTSTPHPTLAPLETPPYYAVPVRVGCLGTKGGPRTDAWGRVRRSGGGVVRGLFAAGNAAANPFGLGTPGGGATIGPALVFGTRAGETAAQT
jgi:succinate dehydrogenase/fumarate reductase flavoprotein subunit